MKIAVLKERKRNESRVAATPDIVRRFVQLGAAVSVETDAGFESYFSDEAYRSAGAQVAATPQEALSGAELLLVVRPPESAVVQLIPEGCMLVGMIEPHRQDTPLAHYAQRRLTVFAMELLPRTSRAQSMDVLSSQANLGGYRAVIEAAYALPKATPMMMTAAGTVAPAKALILGAGVAGLQAIATAKRMGAAVSAFDVRAAVKEQVESLGAKFIAVPSDESGDAKGGYAKEMSEDYKRRQSQLIHETISKQDMVITTAMIPGKPAPILITEEMVKDMKPGAVIMDLAIAGGGNCPLTEADKVVVKHGVTLIGYSNLPARVGTDASPLYSRNLFNFVSTLMLGKQGETAVQWEDELIKGTLLLREGQAVHELFQG